MSTISDEIKKNFKSIVYQASARDIEDKLKPQATRVTNDVGSTVNIKVDWASLVGPGDFMGWSDLKRKQILATINTHVIEVGCFATTGTDGLDKWLKQGSNKATFASKVQTIRIVFESKTHTFDAATNPGQASYRLELEPATSTLIVRVKSSDTATVDGWSKKLDALFAGGAAAAPASTTSTTSSTSTTAAAAPSSEPAAKPFKSLSHEEQEKLTPEEKAAYKKAWLDNFKAISAAKKAGATTSTPATTTVAAPAVAPPAKAPAAVVAPPAKAPPAIVAPPAKLPPKGGPAPKPYREPFRVLPDAEVSKLSPQEQEEYHKRHTEFILADIMSPVGKPAAVAPPAKAPPKGGLLGSLGLPAAPKPAAKQPFRALSEDEVNKLSPQELTNYLDAMMADLNDDAAPAAAPAAAAPVAKGPPAAGAEVAPGAFSKLPAMSATEVQTAFKSAEAQRTKVAQHAAQLLTSTGVAVTIKIDWWGAREDFVGLSDLKRKQIIAAVNSKVIEVGCFTGNNSLENWLKTANNKQKFMMKVKTILVKFAKNPGAALDGPTSTLTIRVSDVAQPEGWGQRLSNVGIL